MDNPARRLTAAIDREFAGEDRVIIIRLTGSLDGESGAYLRGILIDEPPVPMDGHIILDLSALTGLTAPGCGILSSIARLTTGTGRHSVLCGLAPGLRDHLLMLDETLSAICEDVPAARVMLSELIAGRSEPQKNIFPLTYSCPQCGKKLRVKAEGRYRCPDCRIVSAIDRRGGITLDQS
jgi:hypothetical protein